MPNLKAAHEHKHNINTKRNITKKKNNEYSDTSEVKANTLNPENKDKLIRSRHRLVQALF